MTTREPGSPIIAYRVVDDTLVSIPCNHNATVLRGNSEVHLDASCLQPGEIALISGKDGAYFVRVA